MTDQVLITSLMRALSLVRWATLLGAWVGLILSRVHLIRPTLAVVLLVTATALTLVLHLAAHRAPQRLVESPVLAAEVAMGLVLLVADGFVYSDARPQSLPWSWPAAGIAAVGIARGGHLALLVAAVVAAASLNTEVLVLDRFEGPATLPLALSKVGLWLLVGGIAGPLTDRLRRAERLISLVRTREEVGRELHDGVLQTLAVVQRRSDDRELAALARNQENSLRAYLSDTRLTDAGLDGDLLLGGVAPLGPSSEATGLEATLRQLAAEAERLHNLSVTVITAGDCEELAPGTLPAVAGAVRESITNAAKHGGARRVTVYSEPADEEPWTLTVSIKDDGVGFDVASMVEGIGLSRSIRGRIEEVGGRVELTSRQGRGTEVRLWV